ncbi:unnamed protein product [Mytilus coruscus]|uniref:Mab-21-like HhH/H2TH-like domain-containing protein n=1 Tax=Mytilus coruscus TaxID=42192 RepID=A0A6J8DWK0_MYTCO|nr:unnamed protein product [Mytilus coruscus]
MAHSKTESLHFYKYLSQKIGSEEVVRARRLKFLSGDFCLSNKFHSHISSGSRGEGLNLKGSDYDFMTILKVYSVYESEKDVVQDLKLVFVMDTDDTPPGFTHLRLYTNYKPGIVNEFFLNFFKPILQQHRGENLLSSELYKYFLIKNINDRYPNCPFEMNIHGPCLSDIFNCFDFAGCLKADQFNSKRRNTLINTLKKSYQKGIQIFSSSQTLHDYRIFPFDITRPVCELTSLMKTLKDHGINLFQSPIINISGVFNTLLHHCKTELSRSIFKLSTATEYQRIPFVLPHINNPNNKQQYKKYKHELSQLLVGVHSDAVSGWLKLASFFYVHNNFFTSIDIIDYTLSKCYDVSPFSKITLKQSEKLKLLLLLFPSPYISLKKFGLNLSVTPMELKYYHVNEIFLLISSLPYALFLRFLCCYHLHDLNSCWKCINQLSETVREHSQSEGDVYHGTIPSDIILLGIAFQMLGDRDRARTTFRLAAQRDVNNCTSAASRLRQL